MGRLWSFLTALVFFTSMIAFGYGAVYHPVTTMRIAVVVIGLIAFVVLWAYIYEEYFK